MNAYGRKGLVLLCHLAESVLCSRFFVCSSKPSKSSKSSKSSLDLGGFDISDGFDDFDDHMAFYGSRRMSETETPYHVDDKVVLDVAVL